jgi:hypothetical protein
MSNVSNFSPLQGGSAALMLEGSSALRFAPQPRGSSGLSAAAEKVFSVAASAASAAASGFTGVGGLTDIPGLLNKQMEIQLIMQLVSMESNISRSKHETEMAPIRNMRVG